MVKIFSFDPGLAHGAMLLCEWDIRPDAMILSNWGITYQYSKKQKNNLSMKSSSTELFHFFRNLRVEMLKQAGNLGGGTLTGYNIVSDFDMTSVHWHTRKQQIVKLAQLMGYLQRGFHEMGAITGTITPSQIRRWLLLKPSAGKEEVHQAFNEWMESAAFIDDALPSAYHLINNNKSDQKDRDLLDCLVLNTFAAWVHRSKLINSQKII